MIEVSGLTRTFGARKALDNFSLSVTAGETVGLVGRNGAGKSTALRILSCQLLPSQGEVRIAGLSTAEHPQGVRERIGFLPEVSPLYPEMTVTGYLRFAAGIRRMAPHRIEPACREVMALTGLESVASQRLGNLSRGYQQRVGIAQAVIHRPQVVLLDEPMAGLDPLQITQIRALIQGLQGRHTVLFSSHNLSEITRVCDRVVLIEEGRVRAVGSEAELWEAFHHRQQMTLLVRGEAERAAAVAGAVADVAVEGVQPVGEDAAELTLALPPEAAEALAVAMVQAGLGLREMRTERHGLEDLFMRLLGREGEA